MSNDKMILERAYSGDLEMQSDGRTVEGKCVPYGTVITVGDQQGNGKYRECFDYGAFSVMCKAPNRVIFRISHLDQYANAVGWANDLEERMDGLYGSFRLYEADAPKAREMIKESYRGLSVGFVPIRNDRRGDVIHRISARLDHVAAVIEGTAAYPDAMVLAMRDDQGHGVYERGAPEEIPSYELDQGLIDLRAYNEAQRAKNAALMEKIKARTNG